MRQSRIIVEIIKDLNDTRNEYGSKFTDAKEKDNLGEYKYWGGKIEEIDRILKLLHEKNSLT